MSELGGSGDELSEAERALEAHLELLRASAPQPAPLTVTRIIRTARWQRAVRRPVLAMAAVAAAAVDGVRLLVTGGRRR